MQGKMANENPATNSDLELAEQLLTAKDEVSKLKATLKEEENVWSGIESRLLRSTRGQLNAIILNAEKNTELYESKFTICAQAIESLERQVQDLSSRFTSFEANSKYPKEPEELSADRDLSPSIGSQPIEPLSSRCPKEKIDQDEIVSSETVNNSNSQLWEDPLAFKKNDLDLSSTFLASEEMNADSEFDQEEMSGSETVNYSKSKYLEDPKEELDLSSTFVASEGSSKEKFDQEEMTSVGCKTQISESEDFPTLHSLASADDFDPSDINLFRHQRHAQRLMDKLKKYRRMSVHSRLKHWVKDASYLSYLVSTSRQPIKTVVSEDDSESSVDTEEAEVAEDSVMVAEASVAKVSEDSVSEDLLATESEDGSEGGEGVPFDKQRLAGLRSKKKRRPRIQQQKAPKKKFSKKTKHIFHDP